jgi:hypothetical protein
MDSSIEHGYLVLADISGYTSFIQKSELDHGPKIIHNLISIIIDELTPVLRLAEVEGDAVFAYAPASKLMRGELLLELIESAYCAFQNCIRSMVHNATCPCTACRSISGLGLKFIAHYGHFALQNVAGKTKPIGSSVNLAHRLLKNQVEKKTGWGGYALFTEACLLQMAITPNDVHHGKEVYAHLGEVLTISTNLDFRYRELVEGHRDVLIEKDADLVVSQMLRVPPSVLWDWLSDPHKRSLWFTGSAWEAKERPAGRTLPSAQNHCASSGFIETILDWRPFDYYTVRLKKGILKLKITSELKPVPEGVLLQWNIKLDTQWPGWLRRPTTRLIGTAMGVKRNFERMEKLLPHTVPAGL